MGVLTEAAWREASTWREELERLESCLSSMGRTSLDKKIHKVTQVTRRPAPFTSTCLQWWIIPSKRAITGLQDGRRLLTRPQMRRVGTSLRIFGRSAPRRKNRKRITSSGSKEGLKRRSGAVLGWFGSLTLVKATWQVPLEYAYQSMRHHCKKKAQ